MCSITWLRCYLAIITIVDLTLKIYWNDISSICVILFEPEIFIRVGVIKVHCRPPWLRTCVGTVAKLRLTIELCPLGGGASHPLGLRDQAGWEGSHCGHQVE